MKAMTLVITAELLLDFFKPGKHDAYECINNPLPEDSKIVAIFSPENRNEIWLRIESESFSDIVSGEFFPVMSPPVFKRIFKKTGE